MKARWMVVSAMVVLACLALTGAAVQSPAPASTDDPYIGASTISSEAPADRKPCTYYNSQCESAEPLSHCGPLPSSNCYCSWDGRCVSGG